MSPFGLRFFLIVACSLISGGDLLPPWPSDGGWPNLSRSALAAGARRSEAEDFKAAGELLRAGKPQEALELATRLASEIRARSGENNGPYLLALATIGDALVKLGRFPEAEAVLQRTIAGQKVFGSDDTFNALPLHNLAEVYVRTGRCSEAVGPALRASALFEKLLGQRGLAAGLHNLARLYNRCGGYAEAEASEQRALAIRKQQAPPDEESIAESLESLGSIYKNSGRYALSEPLLKRALSMHERIFGLEHVGVWTNLTELAGLYMGLHQYETAVPLYERALRIVEKLYKPDAAVVASALRDLAQAYSFAGRPADAVPLYTRALTTVQRTSGREGVPAADILERLSDAYRGLRRFSEAEATGRQALQLSEKAYGPDDPHLLGSIISLGVVYQETGRYGQAQDSYRRALALIEKRGGTSSPQFITTLANSVEVYLAEDRIAEALEASRRLMRAVVERLATEAIRWNDRRAFYLHIQVLDRAAKARILGPDVEPEMFQAAQRAEQSTAAEALNQLAARFGAGSDALANLVREHQDAMGEYRQLDRSLGVEFAKSPNLRDAGREGLIREKLSQVEARLKSMNARLTAEFPSYAALASPGVLTIDEVKTLIGSDEAVVFLLMFPAATQVFAITREGVAWRQLEINAATLTQKVAAFRHGLDVDALARGLTRVECSEVEANRRGLSRTECDQVLAKECAHRDADARGLDRIECRFGLFDLGAAHELYATLIGPVEPLLNNKHHLLVVPSGALTALPFHLLVSEQPTTAVPQSKNPKDLAIYRNAAWLLKRHAITVLPSVASLKVLRTLARPNKAAKPIVGFGDPVFDQNERDAPAAERTASRSGVQTRGYSEFWQGVGGDRAKLSSLPRLADTADELNTIANSLGAARGDIHLRADASETVVKRAPLEDYSIVYFATHGLVAGDVKGLAEPSLALTMPAQPSELDDGLLTASEVAQLKLNADWVVLSACNTIAGDKPGAEALSGLARAFFYAGARALLVSHWSVDSYAATRLTTTAFEYLKSDPTVGRAEALRRAMLDYMNDTANPQNAYPAFWAPFEVVGEGAAR